MSNKIFVIIDEATMPPPEYQLKNFTFDLQRFDSAFSGGEGSWDNPYQIASVADLQQLSDDVNGGNNYYGRYFIVTANIDLSGVANWQPIGNQYESFAGTFDGNNSDYTISNMKISRTTFNQGLFGYNTGTIKNVTLLNVEITKRIRNNIGGLVGRNSGTVDGCTVTGSVGGDDNIGGIVGYNDYDGQVKNCTVDVQVNGFYSDVGGIVGYNASKQTVIQNNTFHSNADAVGEDRNSSATVNNTRVYEVNAPAEVTATLTSGETVEINGTTYYKDGATFKLKLVSTDNWHQITIKGASQNSDGTFDYIVGTALELEGFPKIGSLAFDGTDTYTIADKADLQALAEFVAAGNTCAGYKFKLGANISDVDFHIGTADSKFAGTLDGDDKTITVAYTDGGALFNYVDGASISKLKVAGTINTSSQFTAGLIGRSYGNTTIDNCTSSVTINSSINGDGTHGGFVGIVDGGKLTISNSTFDGTFNGASTHSWGGFVGWNSGNTEITNGIFNPAQVNVKQTNSATFARNGGNITDSYYRKTLGTAQGEQLFMPDDLPEGVTATYTGGTDYQLVIGDKTYYKPGANFKLTLSPTANDEFSYITDIKGLTKNSDDTFNYTVGTALEFERYEKIGSLGFDRTDNSYTIGTKEQLAEFRDYVNANHDCQGFTFKLTDDINLESIDNWTPIGDTVISFSGTFDGGGHTISNLKITSNKSHVGLFCENLGTIKNVSLLNANVSGDWYVGGIAGDNWGTIDNCMVSGNVSGGLYVGGIVGYDNGNSTIKDNFAATTLSGRGYVGAVVGNNYGTCSGNEYASNVGDNTGATKWLTLPAGITATPDNAADKVTVDGTDYYKPASTVKLTINVTSNDAFEKITGFKGLTANDDNTFDYTVGAALELEGFPKIGSLAFDGTDTYTIADKADLQALAEFVEAGNTCAGYTFKLGANIEGVDFHIGTMNNMFAGTFDGDDKKITVAYEDGGALFNCVDGANISNLTVDGTINTSSQFTAGLIGRSYGNTTIDNCTSSVTINSTVESTGAHGGFVGLVYDGKLTIKDSTFDGSFIGASTHSWGGFVGANGGDTEITGSVFAPAQINVNTISSATFVRNSNNVTDSYCTTTLGTLQGEKIFTELKTPEGVTATYTGGTDYQLVIGDKTYYKPGATFTLTAQDGYGSGLSGYTFKAGNKSATRTSEDVYNLVLGDSDKVELVGFPKIGSLGFDTTDNSYTIGTKEQLEEFRDYVNAKNHDCQGFTFKLTDDINLESIDNWTPIGDTFICFSGTFDGGGHTISNLKITGNESHVGLFVRNFGTIKNVSLLNANVSGRSYSYVGGIAGDNWGTIDNCAVSGTIIGTYNYVGGIAGYNYSGTIKNNFADVTVSGRSNVGAIVGYNYGTCSGNEYASNVGDNTGATKYYSLDLPAGVTASYTGDAANKKTLGSNTYYKPGATFTLTLDKTNADLLANYAQVSGFKNATFNEGTNDYSFTLDEKGTGIQIDGTDWIKGLSCVKGADGYVQYYKLSTSADWATKLFIKI